MVSHDWLNERTGDWVHEFEAEQALAELLRREKIVINRSWWEKDWPERARDSISVAVICNDVFMWGSADAEWLPYTELENVWRMHHRDPVWGCDVWCIARRRQAPQAPVVKKIADAGIWDLSRLPDGPALAAPESIGMWLERQLARSAG